MIRQYYEEWPDQIAELNYPFVDTASRTDNSRAITLSKGHIRDGRLWPTTESSRVFLRSMERGTSFLTFVIADNNQALMSATVDLDVLGTTEKVVFVDSATSRVGGWLRFAPGALTDLHDNPTDTYRFSPAATEFVSTVVSSVRAGGITGFRIGDEVVTGDVVLFGGRGVELGASGSTLTVNAVGDPFARRDICGQGAGDDIRAFLGALLTPIRSISVSYSYGIPPVTTSLGNWVPESGELTASVLEGAPDSGEDRPDHIIRAPGKNGAIAEYIVS